MLSIKRIKEVIESKKIKREYVENSHEGQVYGWGWMELTIINIKINEVLDEILAELEELET